MANATNVELHCLGWRKKKSNHQVKNSRIFSKEKFECFSCDMINENNYKFGESLKDRVPSHEQCKQRCICFEGRLIDEVCLLLSLHGVELLVKQNSDFKRESVVCAQYFPDKSSLRFLSLAYKDKYCSGFCYSLLSSDTVVSSQKGNRRRNTLSSSRHVMTTSNFFLSVRSAQSNAKNFFLATSVTFSFSSSLGGTTSSSRQFSHFFLKANFADFHICLVDTSKRHLSVLFAS